MSKQRSNADTNQHLVTVWYDKGCPLCVREIALMRRLDTRGRLEFLDAQNAASCDVAPEMLLARLHARQTDGSIVSGAAAFAAMWREIPLLRPLGIIAQQPLVLRLLEYGYRGFLRVRPLLQRAVIRAGLKP